NFDRIHYKDGVTDPLGPTYRVMLADANVIDPHVTGSPKQQALEVVPLAIAWLNNAVIHLAGYIGFLESGVAGPYNTAIIQPHLHLGQEPGPALDNAKKFLGNYVRIQGFLGNPANIVEVGMDDMERTNRCYGWTAPAYCSKDRPVTVTPY